MSKKIKSNWRKRLMLKIAAACCGLTLMTGIAATASVEAAAFPPVRNTTEGLAMSSRTEADIVGQEILKKGGNAIDAAVAVGYALAVVHPSCGNIGGGGFAIIHTADGKDLALDFREKAPAKATRDMYLDANGEVIPDASIVGHRAAGVPGTVKGMSEMLSKYGTMSLAEVMAPAIKLADKGFTISHHEAYEMKEAQGLFEKFDATKKYFMKADGTTYKDGELIVQKDLAKTLRTIAKEGPDAFYKGKVADLIVADMEKQGGIITKQDLADYNTVWRDPIKGSYRGYGIVSMCPPSSGGIHILEILNVMENADVAAMGPGSAAKIHLMAEAMRYAYADRSKYLGDPDFVKVPIAELTDKAYAKSIYNKIKADKATPSSEVRPGLELPEGTHTTHYSVADKYGNAVAVTYTINSLYGSGAAVEGAGFLLNNEMDDFAAKAGVPNQFGLVGSDANCIEPAKRPLSSMSPTIVTKDGKLFMVVGSPGGSRIITTVLQTISNVIDHKMNVSEAVAYPRVHMQWLPDELRIEKNGVTPDAAEKLKAMGYDLKVKDYMGDVNAIVVDRDHGVFYGAHDPRSYADESAI